MKIDGRAEDKEHTQLHIGNRKMRFENCEIKWEKLQVCSNQGH